MTTVEPEAAEPRSRTARFWGAWAFALGAAIFLQVAGGAVTPLWALGAPAGSPPAAQAPADPVTPVGADGSTPAPTPTTTSACAAPASTYSTRVCAAATALGWPLTVEGGGSLREGGTFTVLVNVPGGALGTSDPVPPLVRGQRLAVPDITGGSVVTFDHQGAGIMTAEVTSLPAQSDAGIATAIRTAIGAHEIYFLEGDALADGPTIGFGKGWQIATAYDPSRTVGAQFTADSVTLTVKRSDSGAGTFYDVA